MPGKNTPEFTWLESRQEFRKRLKDEYGNWTISVYGKTKPELRRKVTQRKKEIEQRKAALVSPKCWEYTKQWFELWSPGKSKRNIDDKRNAINNHILPYLGDKLMIEVTEADLQEIINSLSDKSNSLNNKVLRTIKEIFRSAYKNHIISENPSEDLKSGGLKTKEKAALTPEQEKILLNTVKDTKIYGFCLLGLNTGLRREELLALQFDCVHENDQHPYIEVKRALHWDEHSNQPTVNDVLKSNAANRKIPIPPEVVDYLKECRKTSAGSYVLSGAKPWTKTQFRKGWDCIKTRSVRTETKIDCEGTEYEVKYKLGDKIKNHKIWITIDFPVTPHQLRHTYITKLILAGVNIKIVQYLAGHATPQITLNIYTHLMENRPEDTAGVVLEALNSQKVEQ